MDNTVVQPLLAGLRYAIVAGGTILVSKGYVSADVVSEAATAAVTIGTALWGVYTAYRKSHALKGGAK